jgi:3-phenylpropionate/trans-cinnamate dioxygenase ferredoxin reductase subunit
MTETFVIVGAGLAGGGAAATLREEGFDGRVVLIGAEPQPPYERPPLSKEYLRGESPFEQALFQPLDFYGENDIETRFGVRLNRVDATEKVIELDNGESLPYEALLFATGARNRRIPIPGLDLEGIYDLRTVADSDRIRAEISPGHKAVVVGMGFIGSEVAASLRLSGVEVTVVDRNTVPLRRVLGEEVGRIVEGIHRDRSPAEQGRVDRRGPGGLSLKNLGERRCSRAKGRCVWIGKDSLAPAKVCRDGPPPWPYCRSGPPTSHYRGT